MKGCFDNRLNEIKNELKLVDTELNLLKAIISYIGSIGNNKVAECIYIYPLSTHDSS